MVVCQYFLKGQCRFGDNCRNEHPAGGQQSSFGNSSWTRPTGGATATTTMPDVAFTAAIIQADLTPGPDKPNWPLSSYAAGKFEPLLLSGLDESPEELRTKYVAALKAGNVNEYLQYESGKIAAAEQVYANARMNSTQAFEQAVKQSTANAASATSAFGQASGSVFPSTSSAFSSVAPTTSVFGNVSTPSAFGSTTTPGTSAFGNLTTPAKSVFANTTTPSAFGTPNTTTSAFGSTSTPATAAFGSTTTPSTFSSTTTPSVFGKSAFGQPAFGQPAFGQTGFSTPATPATTGAFGQTLNTTTPVSAFGQPAQSTPTPSAFGQPATTSAFGQPSFGQTSQPVSSLIKPASGAFSAFAGTGASPFGAAATSTPSTANTAGTGGGFSAFAGTPSAFGSTAATPQTTSGSVFGQPSFGQPVAAATGGGGSAFGTPAQGGTTSAFGALAPAQAQGGSGSVFGSGAPLPAFGGGGPTSAFGVSGPPSAFDSTTNPPLSAFAQMQPQAQPQSVFGDGAFGSQAPAPAAAPPALSVFAPTEPSISTEMKSSVSRSKPLDFTAMKGRYKPGSTPYDQTLPPAYTDMLPKDALEAFQAPKFEWGAVPEWIPPLSVR